LEIKKENTKKKHYFFHLSKFKTDYKLKQRPNTYKTRKFKLKEIKYFQAFLRCPGVKVLLEVQTVTKTVFFVFPIYQTNYAYLL
jgi:hypothetical protein